MDFSCPKQHGSLWSLTSEWSRTKAREIVVSPQQDGITLSSSCIWSFAVTEVWLTEQMHAHMHECIWNLPVQKASSFSWWDICNYLKGNNSTCSPPPPTNVPRTRQRRSEEHCWDTPKDGPLMVIPPCHARWILVPITILWEWRVLLSPFNDGHILKS